MAILLRWKRLPRRKPGPSHGPRSFAPTLESLEARQVPSVTGTGLTLAAVEGAAFSGPVAAFTDTNQADTASSFTAAIDWGDGTSANPDVTAGTVSGSGGSFTVTGNHTYAEEAHATPVLVTLQTTDVSPVTGTAHGTANIADARLGAIAFNVTATEQAAFNGTVARFVDGDPAAAGGDFAATIDWGDGTTPTSGTVASDGNGGFTVTGSHTYTDEGTRPVTVTITDAGGSTVTASATNQTNLVSDGFTSAAHKDPNLLNPWGIAFMPGGPFWVADNNQGVLTVYDGSGVNQGLVVTVPVPPGSSAAQSSPTGLVFNGTTDFAIVGGASTFLAATEDGTIAAWNASLGSLGSVNAVLVVNNSAGGAVYKGLALGSAGGANFLYAANFHAGTVDVFDTHFAAHSFGAGAFTDPNLPGGFAPFGIQNIGGNIFVAYAEQLGPANHDSQPGAGLGFIDVYDSSGHLLQRLVSGGVLNSPWGMTLAPANFGAFSNDLLVGNFGDGRVNAFDPTTGHFLGTLSINTGTALTNGDLWGLTFGNGAAAAGATNQLFFAAGTNSEADGLFGMMTVGGAAAPVTEPLLPGGTRGDANQRFIAEVYEDLLGRAVDAQGLQSATTALEQLGLTRTQVVLGIENSDEYRLDEVNSLYQLYLKRPANPATDPGVNDHLQFLKAGGAIEMVVVSIANSPEYFKEARIGQNNDNFLAAFYSDSLNRPIQPTEKSTGDSLLAAGNPRGLIAQGLTTTEEYRQDLVKHFYQQFLDRGFDSPSLGGWTAALDAGLGDGRVIAQLLGDPGMEYFNKTAS